MLDTPWSLRATPQQLSSLARACAELARYERRAIRALAGLAARREIVFRDLIERFEADAWSRHRDIVEALERTNDLLGRETTRDEPSLGPLGDTEVVMAELLVEGLGRYDEALSVERAPWSLRQCWSRARRQHRRMIDALAARHRMMTGQRLPTLMAPAVAE